MGLTHPVTPSSPSYIPTPASIHPPPACLLLPFIGYLTLFLLTLLSLYLSWLGLLLEAKDLDERDVTIQIVYFKGK